MRTGALIKRICQQMLRDKRTLALLFLAPLLVLTLMYFLFNSNAVEPTLGIVNVNPSVMQVLQAVGKIMPIYYGADALKGVMYKGVTFSEVSGDILALVVFAAIFITLNTFALKKYRRL